ncbi:prepilin-type N-terminal cleavage/methylation domain-containing protein [Patescibacteria group bacterium]
MPRKYSINSKKVYTHYINRKHSGFTLIEIVVAIGVLGIFFATTALLLQQILEGIARSRIRTTAMSIAQEKMELARNLPYTDVGTVGGIPQGNIEQNEEIIINGLTFTITTTVTYIDDPYDGLAPVDIINSDYKRIHIAISWGGTYPSLYPLTLSTNISPKGLETDLGEGGTLQIQVFDATGIPIPNATVTVDNVAILPEIHAQYLTDTQGYIILPESPTCITCYEINISKSGYSSDKTYSSAEVTNPLKPHATILDGQITDVSFSIDRLSSISVRSYGSKNLGYPTITNVTFTLKGSKIIGYDTSDNPVYKFSYTTNTGGGSVGIPNLEWDAYSLEVTSHDFAGSNPYIPFNISPNSATTIPIVTLPKTNASLLVIVTDPVSEPLASASVQLKNTVLAYDVSEYTASTGTADFGQTFFNSLTPETYDIRVDLPGFETATASVEISGHKQQYFKLNTYVP